MSESYPPPTYDYIAFIDEAGDPGISKIRPIDPSGGSEWLTLGAALIRRENETNPVEWIRNILRLVDLTNRTSLHFRELAEWRKPLVCQQVAELPLRLFVLASNKKSMRHHKNPRAATRASPLTSKQYFYNYCLRLLLERVTDYCLRHSLKHKGVPRHVKLIFSSRGGHAYGHTFAYGEILKNQSRAQTTFLTKRTLKWEVIDRRLMEAIPHTQNAGLQLADIVASAFYQAVDTLSPAKWNPEYAKLLRPRIATEHGFYNDYGVAFQPSPPWKARLTAKQKLIFEFYDYDGRDF